MGKKFDVEAFRQAAAAYDERVREWSYEGNRSYFDQSQWIHEWFGEPEYGSLYHDYAAENGTIEAACEFRSKLVFADISLWDIRDNALTYGDLKTVNAVMSALSEIVEELDAIDEYLWGDE